MTDGPAARPTAVLADDEPPLLAYLRRELQAAWPELAIVGEAGDGEQALAMIQALRPDLAFLDIRMPGLSGLEVAARLAQWQAARASGPGPAAPCCRVVFVTAYDQYAVDAFEQAAVDYLLKPVTGERLQRTIERLRTSAADRAPAPGLPELLELVRGLRAPPTYLHWLQAAQGDELTLLPAADIDLFQSSDKVTLLSNPRGEWVIRTALKELEEQLDPAQFWRVHRNAIVRVGAIERVSRDLQGQLQIRLAGRARLVAVSRAYAHRFKGM